MNLDRLTPQLKQLRLSGILDTLDQRTKQAISEQWTYEEYLTRLVHDEVERRAHKQLALRIRRGGLDPTKTLETFDFSFNPSINRQLLFDLATCEFVRQHRNVLLCGQTGVGKTMLAQALANEAVRKGFDVLFVTAHRMLSHLNAGRADGSEERRLAAYLRPDVLVIDDFGLKPMPPSGSADIYDVIDGRYEKGSIVLTSNRSPEEWLSLFPDQLLGNAGLDRLADRAVFIQLTGPSYRLSRKGVETSK